LIKTILLIILFLILANIAVSIIFSLIGVAISLIFKIAVIAIFFLGCLKVYQMITGKSIKFFPLDK